MRLIPTRANTQPAFGHYIDDPHTPLGRYFGVIVLTLEGDRIAGLTRFGDSGILPLFGLPRRFATERRPGRAAKTSAESPRARARA